MTLTLAPNGFGARVVTSRSFFILFNLGLQVIFSFVVILFHSPSLGTIWIVVPEFLL